MVLDIFHTCLWKWLRDSHSNCTYARDIMRFGFASSFFLFLKYLLQKSTSGSRANSVKRFIVPVFTKQILRSRFATKIWYVCVCDLILSCGDNSCCWMKFSHAVFAVIVSGTDFVSEQKYRIWWPITFCSYWEFIELSKEIYYKIQIIKVMNEL